MAEEGQAAGSPTKHCPTLGKKRPKDAPPCDLKQVFAHFSHSSGDLTVKNHLRSAAEKRPPGVSDEEAELLEKYAVVIVQRLGYGVEGSGASSGHDPTSDMNARSSRKARALANVSAPEHCNFHPRYDGKGEDDHGPETARTGLQAKAIDLKIEAVEFSLSEFLKRAWHGKLSEFVKPSESAAVFDFWSCGYPSAGEPVGELKAHVAMRALDSWLVSFHWAEGFLLEFGKTSMTLKDHRDGATVSQDTSTSKSGGGGTVTSDEDKTTVVTKNDSGVLYKHGDARAEDDQASHGTMESQTRRGKAEAPEGKGRSGRAVNSALEHGDHISEKFESLGKSVDAISSGHGFGFKVVRNGQDQIDSDELGEAIENLKGFIDTALDLVRRMMLICRTACQMGLPVSVTFSFELKLRILRGTFSFQVYDKDAPPLKADAYYLARSERKWAVSLGVAPLSGSFTTTFEFLAKVLHKWVASLSVKVEVTWKGSSRIVLSYDQDSHSAGDTVGGTLFATVTVTGEVNAATFYLQAKATATSGIEHQAQIRAGGAFPHVVKNHVRTRKLEMQISVRYGNKVWDFIGLGSDEPDWQWPADKAFVLIQDGAIDEELSVYHKET